ncbi:MAG: class I SAM-dependent methyltransferase [Paludibacteraceae bacterium]|nr:class I SAM-dependent methyltransferase [Paludibacteraceae bacterium]
MFNVETLGQVFTPQSVVAQMLTLRHNDGRILEPSCGNGAFFNEIPDCVGIEIDIQHCPKGALNMDFFDYPLSEKFDTIIGNPPYVRYQDISAETKKKLKSSLFDERSNLYLFFIEKCINHLNDHGELIFITPRDYLKATSSIRLNQFIFNQGTITDIIDLGDKNIFKGFSPNCIIFRFEKGNYSRATNVTKRFTLCNGQLLFTDNQYPLQFGEIFFVKVGAVSGADKYFESEEFGNREFVCSFTCQTGKTKRMIFNEQSPYLSQYKQELLNRGIKHFDESNWWMWGRNHYMSNEKRIYVNAKTRNNNPFFLHPSNDYDGSVLAIFPYNQSIDMQKACDMLNGVNWYELGFICDGRYLFSQNSLESAPLPATFNIFIRKDLLF